MVLLRLFFEFFKAGLFAIGGGLATIPFLYEISEKTALVRLSSLLAHKLNIGSPEGYEVSLKEIPLLSKGVGFNIDTYKKDLDNICKISKEQFEKEKENY